MICTQSWRTKMFYCFACGKHDACMYFISVFSYHSRDNLPVRARQKLFPRPDNQNIQCRRFIKLGFLSFKDFICQIFVSERYLVSVLCIKNENTNLIDFS